MKTLFPYSPPLNRRDFLARAGMAAAAACLARSTSLAAFGPAYQSGIRSGYQNAALEQQAAQTNRYNDVVEGRVQIPGLTGSGVTFSADHRVASPVHIAPQSRN